MDELEISGKRYLSTRRAAREHGYHSDYMGQLIRSGKVVGQKVGRSWYIEEETLNVYLGKAPATPAAPVVATAEIKPEPVHEPVHVTEVAPIPAPVAVHVEIQKEEVAAQQAPAIENLVQVVQEPTPAPVREEVATRIPIHIPKEAVQDIGGLRYAADDAPSLPAVVRMPRPQPAAAPMYAPAATRSFPYVSLSVVAVLALMASAFISNFVSATIVSQPGQTATVEYAIHW